MAGLLSSKIYFSPNKTNKVGVEDAAVFANDGIHLSLEGVSLVKELRHFQEMYFQLAFGLHPGFHCLQIIFENGVLASD